VLLRTIDPSMRSRSVSPTAEQYRRVFRFVRRRVGSEDVAEDVTQEVFASIARSLAESAKTAQPPLAWLYTVARHRIADEARRVARTPAVSLELVEPAEARPDAYGGEVARALDAAVAALPEGQRRVVLERLIQGRSFADIAASLHTSEEACRMRFMRGLQQLRCAFEKEGLTP
jgi:RNA polymerase sigma-70 factor (ECF subfamily)